MYVTVTVEGAGQELAVLLLLKSVFEVVAAALVEMDAGEVVDGAPEV